MLQVYFVILVSVLSAAHAAAQMIGVNMLLNTPPTAPVLAQLQALPCVADANADAIVETASMPEITVPDFAGGANQ